MNNIKDLFEVVGKRMVNDIQKSMIRQNYSPNVAESMCASIDAYEKVEHLNRLLAEYNEWIMNRLRIQAALLQNLVCYRWC